MNTLLHVFEGYTELYRVTKDKRVGENLRWMLDIFAKKVYNPDKKRQEVFFDKDWNTPVSYTHLDVYKRQVMHRVSYIIRRYLRKQELQSFQRHQPVSYTHLVLFFVLSRLYARGERKK